MPAMPRPKGKARKIAWSILGKPVNLEIKRTPKAKRLRRRFIVQETALAR